MLYVISNTVLPMSLTDQEPTVQGIVQLQTKKVARSVNFTYINYLIH